MYTLNTYPYAYLSAKAGGKDTQRACPRVREDEWLAVWRHTLI